MQPEVTDYAHHINTSPSSTHWIFRPSYGPVLSDLSILRARITEICAAHKGSSHGIPRRPFSDHITKVRLFFFVQSHEITQSTTYQEKSLECLSSYRHMTVLYGHHQCCKELKWFELTVKWRVLAQESSHGIPCRPFSDHITEMLFR